MSHMNSPSLQEVLDNLLGLVLVTDPEGTIILASSALVRLSGLSMKNLIAQGKFREDMFYRLNVLPIKIPPLRERTEDVPELVEIFLAEFNKKYGTQKHLSAEAFESVMTYDWASNVRELRNVISVRGKEKNVRKKWWNRLALECPLIGKAV